MQRTYDGCDMMKEIFMKKTYKCMSPENIFGGWHFIIIAFPRVFS